MASTFYANTELDRFWLVLKCHIKRLAQRVSIWYFKSMAKLKDLENWMEKMLRGDGARARSLVQLCRKAGLFTTGGRGSGSPDMTASDATNAIFAVLYDGPPTGAPEAIKALAELPLVAIDVYPDGPREETSLMRYNQRNIPDFRGPLPLCLSAAPTKAFDAIFAAMAFERRPYHMSEIKVSKGNFRDYLTFYWHDPDIATDSKLCSETDFFLFDAMFAHDFQPGKTDTHGRYTEHSLGGDLLDDLYCLIHGIDPWADEGGYDG